MKKAFILYLAILLLVTGCDFFHPEIEITRDYIYNSAWGNDKNASVLFRKVKIDTSKIKMNQLDSYSGFEIWHNVLPDSIHSQENRLPFDYFIYGTERRTPKKIYFNKKNQGVVWEIWEPLDAKPREVFGQLELNTWYVFFALYEKWLYYVYIDNEGTSHVWGLNPVNI